MTYISPDGSIHRSETDCKDAKNKANGESGGVIAILRNPVDAAADAFWRMLAVIILFFQTIFSPRGGFKPTAPNGGGPRIHGVGRGTMNVRGGGG